MNLIDNLKSQICYEHKSSSLFMFSMTKPQSKAFYFSYVYVVLYYPTMHTLNVSGGYNTMSCSALDNQTGRHFKHHL